ncbi:MAG: NAD(P)/FAD-dependent oxidoreductase [Bacteroidota bacterium]
MNKTIVIIGGGAAGFFAAVNIAKKNPNYRVILFEKSDKLLYKVQISGGGRCNVTHSCFEPMNLVKFYPRGEKSLISVFHRFQPKDTIQWFEERGVPIKREEDGRMFPQSNTSQTIIDCFLKEAKKYQVEIYINNGIDDLEKIDHEKWLVKTSKGEKLAADKIVFCSGSQVRSWKLLEKLGHTVSAPVPSLFTFNTKDLRLNDLMGTSIPKVQLKIKGTKLMSEGPLLITHWGLSGPAILKLSAWGARELASIQYKFTLLINWTGTKSYEEVLDDLKEFKISQAKKQLSNTHFYELTNRMRDSLLLFSKIDTSKKWADISMNEMKLLAQLFSESHIEINGKSTNKDEFVTCGGVELKEVDFKTMQSKLEPNLFFAGEVLDIDAITGGFNFQAAWSSAWVVSESV